MTSQFDRETPPIIAISSPPPPQSPALFALPFGVLRPLPPPSRHLHQARSIGANRHALGDLGALGRQYAAFGSVMERSHERKTP